MTTCNATKQEKCQGGGEYFCKALYTSQNLNYCNTWISLTISSQTTYRLVTICFCYLNIHSIQSGEVSILLHKYCTLPFGTKPRHPVAFTAGTFSEDFVTPGWKIFLLAHQVSTEAIAAFLKGHMLYLKKDYYFVCVSVCAAVSVSS